MSNLIIKPRTESEELILFRSLNNRFELSEKERIYYSNLEKGYFGEVMFDEGLKTLTNDFLILNDLIFEHNNNEFQIDSLLLSQHKGYMFEVKNFYGDYYIEDNKFCSKNGKERRDPLLQMQNTASLLRQLLQKLGINYHIEHYLIFVNPEFYLYNATMNQPIIFPNQLKRFMKQLDIMPSRLSQKHQQLADKLMENCLKKSKYTKCPEYQYGDLKKGFTCMKCHSFCVEISGHNLICNECDYKEKVRQAILRCTEELRILQPDRKITTNGVIDWCNTKYNKKSIQIILSENYKSIGHGKGTYYV